MKRTHKKSECCENEMPEGIPIRLCIRDYPCDWYYIQEMPNDPSLSHCLAFQAKGEAAHAGCLGRME